MRPLAMVLALFYDALTGALQDAGAPCRGGAMLRVLALRCVASGGRGHGLAQTTLHETPWAFVAVPVASALSGFPYGAAFLGQGLGAEDMHALRSFVVRMADDVGA